MCFPCTRGDIQMCPGHTPLCIVPWILSCFGSNVFEKLYPNAAYMLKPDFDVKINTWIWIWENLGQADQSHRKTICGDKGQFNFHVSKRSNMTNWLRSEMSMKGTLHQSEWSNLHQCNWRRNGDLMTNLPTSLPSWNKYSQLSSLYYK